MLYNLLAPFAEESSLFNIFRYLTFRSGGAVMTALLLSFLLGPRVIAPAPILPYDSAEPAGGLILEPRDPYCAAVKRRHSLAWLVLGERPR